MSAWSRFVVCRSCGTDGELGVRAWRCSCGGLFDLRGGSPRILRDSLPKRPPTMWRYVEALPVDPTDPLVQAISLGEGFTPLVRHKVGSRSILLKLEFLSPTLSFKDRGAVLLAIQGAELGAREIVVDSSGNAATALSAYAARAHLECTVFVPRATSARKLVQMSAHGARVVQVDGSRKDTAMAAIEHVESTGAFYGSHVYNPIFYEGTKTYGLEVWEQLGFQAPDLMVLPAGNGTLVLGVARAFDELVAQGFIDRLPRLLVVQAQACAPIANAYRPSEEALPPSAGGHTIAEGIAIAAPPRASQVIETVERYNGAVIAVDDQEIQAAAAELAAAGLFVEPTAAAPLAGAKAYLGSSRVTAEDAVVVVPLSGAGLKTA